MSEKIPKGWKWVKLGDVVIINPNETLKKGIIAKKVPMEALHPFTKKVKFFVFEKYNGGVKFKNGDTLVARITPSLENGKTVYVDLLDDDEIGFGSTEFIVLREKSGITDKQFVYYFAISNDFRDIAIKSMTGSSGRQRVQNEVVKEFEFPLPPLPEQKAISEVLSSIDDKIDLLHRQNKTLEEMAMTLFRKWFIEPTKDGLPEGWEEVELSKLGQIVCGKTPSKNKPEYFGGKIPFIKIPDMHGNVFVFKTEDTLSEIGAKTQKNKTLPERSICVSCIATVGLVSMNAFISQTNQQINSIIPYKEFYRYFLYLKTKSVKEELIAMASGGTATLNLNTTEFSKIKIEIPKEDYLHAFHEKIKYIFEKIFINTSQIQTLEKLRDTLLPKLMSGEVRIIEDKY